jgi:hypothetical protein
MESTYQLYQSPLQQALAIKPITFTTNNVAHQCFYPKFPGQDPEAWQDFFDDCNSWEYLQGSRQRCDTHVLPDIEAFDFERELEVFVDSLPF